MEEWDINEMNIIGGGEKAGRLFSFRPEMLPDISFSERNSFVNIYVSVKKKGRKVQKYS